VLFSSADYSILWYSAGMDKLWFKAKKYGYGWYPVTWQGWAVVGLYVVGMVAIFRDVDKGSHSGSDTLFGIFVPMALMTIALILVCTHKGEPAEWRWGKKETHEKNSQ
jgi:hypothetical protein